MKQKILFTGGSGLLATNWTLHIAGKYDVVSGMHVNNISLPGVATMKLDLESSGVFASDLEKIRPNVVIHCAGLTSVEKCEQDPSLGAYVNTTLAVHAAKACYEQGIRFVYICTDHLFNGHTPNVTEEEPISPLNVYAVTKAAAEEQVFSISKDFLSIRTNFYGWGTARRPSFSDSILAALRNKKNISLFTDVFYTPILIETLAGVVMKLLEKNEKGIFNVAGSERLSKYEFGIRLARQFGLDDSRIIPSKFADRHDLVQRPFDLSLSNKKAIASVGEFGNINNDILQLFRQEQNGFASLIKAL